MGTNSRPPAAIIYYDFDGVTLGIMKNPKCASTTVLNYLGQAIWGAKTGEILLERDMKNNGVEYIYENSLELIKQFDIRVALYRDPVEKLHSGFHHVVKNGMSFQGFLDGYDRHMNQEKIRRHCSSNTANLGPDKSIYTDLIMHHEVDGKLLPIIEGLSGRKITPVHQRDQSKSKSVLTEEEYAIAKEIMKEDYENGWV